MILGKQMFPDRCFGKAELKVGNLQVSALLVVYKDFFHTRIGTENNRKTYLIVHGTEQMAVILGEQERISIKDYPVYTQIFLCLNYF